MKSNKNITTLEEHIDQCYGLRGTKLREEFEQQSIAFRLGVLIEDARTKLGLTQAELARRCDTNKSHISRIESGSADISFSTLVKIIHEGLGGRLDFTIEV